MLFHAVALAISLRSSRAQDADYVKMPLNTTAGCDAASVEVIDEVSCRAAGASFGVQFLWSENDGDLPEGCFYVVGINGSETAMGWNTQTWPDIGSVCQEDGADPRKYSKMQLDTHGCAAGFVAIPDEVSCSAAAVSLGRTYGGSRRDSGASCGCFYQGGGETLLQDGGLWWNAHTRCYKTWPNVASVCQTGNSPVEPATASGCAEPDNCIATGSSASDSASQSGPDGIAVSDAAGAPAEGCECQCSTDAGAGGAAGVLRCAGGSALQGASCACAEGSFAYHKGAFPLDWHHDGLTILLASVGLVIAASGGIGGGGILVPLFMLVLGFHPKHAIALSNFTILGGSIANTALNRGKKHPRLNRGLIDWDLIVIMEPLTIFGAVFGSLLSKVLPNVILTTALVVILAFMGHRTLKKGIKMWTEESQGFARVVAGSDVAEMLTTPDGDPEASTEATGENLEEVEMSYLELREGRGENGSAKATGLAAAGVSGAAPVSAAAVARVQRTRWKIFALTLCFGGTCSLTLLKGGGTFPSPLGFECGSAGFWALYFGSLPWVLLFAVYFRWLLVREFEQKVRSGYRFDPGEVQWSSENTIRYPSICAISGLLAGLFGVGGGIVKGPLMIEMGIMPAVASASAAAMILYTSAAASTSFVVFGLLHWEYGLLFFSLGLVCTAVGQYTVGQWVKKHQRQSPIVLSIGTVITLSSVLVAMNTVASSRGVSLGELMRAHGVCSGDS